VANSGLCNTTSVIDTTTNKVTATVNVGAYPIGVAFGRFISPLTKSNSTMESNSTPFLNSINRTENQTNNTGMTANKGTVGKQERESNPTQKSINANGSGSNINNSGGNKLSKTNSAPGFGLLGGLTCLYGGWRLRKK
jgi:YVTN family beta-propeller protein